MKALTIWQPWASLIMIGAKPYEFRRWDYCDRFPAIVGQRIVIHAGARPMKPAEVLDIKQRIIGGESALRDAVALPLIHKLLAAYKCQGVLPLAAGLGTAIINRPIRCTEMFPDSDRIDEHMWGWPLTQIESWTPPVEMRGAQGFWDWPLKVAA